MSKNPSRDRLMQGVIPYIAIDDADAAIVFYQKAWGAELFGEATRAGPQNKIMNASLEINGGVIMVMDSMPEQGVPAAKGGHGFTLQLVVTDGDPWWSRAVAAGCEVRMAFEVQFWGDRFGQLRDPFGIDWAINEPSAENQAKAKELRP